VKKALKEYRVEVFALVIAVLGLLMVLQRHKIEPWLKTASSQLIAAAGQLNESLRVSVPQFIASLTPMTIAGVIIVLAMVAFVVWRIRYRFFNSERFKATVCPKCGSEIHRIHRSLFDRFLTWTLLPFARRYGCENPDCNWTGLRRRRHHEQIKNSPETEEEA
jgi:hypothetical protein